MLKRCIDSEGASAVTQGKVYQSSLDETLLPSKKNLFSRTTIILNDEGIWGIYSDHRFEDASIHREKMINQILDTPN